MITIQTFKPAFVVTANATEPFMALDEYLVQDSVAGCIARVGRVQAVLSKYEPSYEHRIEDFRIFVGVDGGAILEHSPSGRTLSFRFDIEHTEQDVLEVIIDKVILLLDQDEDFIMTDVKEYGRVHGLDPHVYGLDPKKWFMAKDLGHSFVLGYRAIDGDGLIVQAKFDEVLNAQQQRGLLKDLVGAVSQAIKSGD